MNRSNRNYLFKKTKKVRKIKKKKKKKKVNEKKVGPQKKTIIGEKATIRQKKMKLKKCLRGKEVGKIQNYGKN